MAPARSIAIAGAGVAGLTAALAFAKAGFAAKVFERSPKLEEIGAGIQLSPNATRILARLGVLEALSPMAVQPREIAIRRADTLRRLASVPLGEAARRRWGAPYLTVHRADLQAALLAVAGDSAHIELTTGAAVRDAAQEGDAVALSVERDGRSEAVRCDLAVGADGVWSTLRPLVAKQAPGRYTGHLAWRALARPDGDLLPADRVTAWLHPGFHLVAYPVRAGAEVNLVAVTTSPATPESWSNAADPRALTMAMTGVAPALTRLIEQAGPWTTWPIHAVPQHGGWTAGRIALIGDAAHAMSPYAAQGAAMAIEDAAVLAGAVAHSAGDMAAALARYEALRRPRVKRVAGRGAFNRFTWHASGPVALVRDAVLSRRAPERLAADLDWLYGWEPEVEIA